MADLYRLYRIGLVDRIAGLGGSNARGSASVTLVLLHPLPLDASIWSDELFVLADAVVAPTLYSLGGDIRDWARAVLDLAGDGPMTIVGNSIGGSCAIEVALLAPDKVKALVLSGTKAGHDPDAAFRDAALGLLSEHGVAAAFARYWEPLFGPSADKAVIRRAFDIAVAQGAAIANGVRVFHGRPSRDDFLDSWCGPVWVVAGEYDIRPERAEMSARRLKGGRFRKVAGAGHFVPLEAPQEFGRIVAEAVSSP